MQVEIVLSRHDRCYSPGEKVSGVVLVKSNSAGKHAGIKLNVQGTASLQLSAKSIGVFEAFYSSLKPVQLLSYDIEVSPGGKVTKAGKEYPFEFSLAPVKGQNLFDTYHGVYVTVQYLMTCDLKKSGMMGKNAQVTTELVVQVKTDSKTKKTLSKQKKFPFKISPDTLQNVKEASKEKLPQFQIEGFLRYTTCCLEEPLQGAVTVKRSKAGIKSIELQLVRVETCSFSEQEAREATEIQNIQIADGDVARNLAIPIHMVFPRLFTCATAISKSFKVEFEVNLIILFNDSLVVTENFPIKLFR